MGYKHCFFIGTWRVYRYKLFWHLFGICLVVAFTLKAWEIAGILQKCLSPTDGNYAKIRPTANYTEIAGNCTGITGYCAEIVRNYAGW